MRVLREELPINLTAIAEIVGQYVYTASYGWWEEVGARLTLAVSRRCTGESV